MPPENTGPTGAHAVDLHIDQPHAARMYDYFLDGKDNYEADRLAAAEVERVFPTVRLAARTNRSFMQRAARYLAGAGVWQFLDIGTGIPTAPNLHQVVQAAVPRARVVYVDNDPIVLAHARALMVSSDEGRTAYLPADVTRPREILAAPKLTNTLDLSQPVALSMLALLHFVPDRFDAYGIVATLLDALAPGSYLVMSHATQDFDPDGTRLAGEVYEQRGVPFQHRDRAGFSRFFDGLDLVEPGVTTPHRWHPGIETPASMDTRVSFYAAVGRKPGG